MANTPAPAVQCFTKEGFTPDPKVGGFFTQVHSLYAQEGVEITALLKVLKHGARRDRQLEVLSVQECPVPNQGFYDVYFQASEGMMFSLGYDWRAKIDQLNKRKK